MKNILFFLNVRILLFALASLVIFSYSYSNFSTLVYGQSTVVNNTAIYVNSSINDNNSITSSNKILEPAGNLTIGSMPQLTNSASNSQDKNAILESNNSLNSNDINHTSLMSSNPITNYSGSSNYLPSSSSSSTSSLPTTTNSTQNITGVQEGNGQEIDTGDEEEHILTVPEAQAIKSNLVIPDSSPFKSNQCTPVGSLEKFVPNPFMKDLNTTRFIVGNCITVTGKVTWTHYINTDGDANFNLKPDSKYSSLLTPVNMNSQKLKGALHVEVVCQGKNTSTDPVKKNQCKDPKYNGPDFKGVLPTVGQHVEVTGIYVIDVREGGHAELHPAYHIKSIS